MCVRVQVVHVLVFSLIASLWRPSSVVLCKAIYISVAGVCVSILRVQVVLEEA
jgi:hypothetical protein